LRGSLLHGTRQATSDHEGRDHVGGVHPRRDALPASLAAPPEQLASALSRSDAGSRQDVLACLQAAGGNLEVGRLVQSASTPVDTMRYSLEARIPMRHDKGPEAGKSSHQQETQIEKAGAATQQRGGGGGGGGGGGAPAAGGGGGSSPAAAGPTQATAGGGGEAPGQAGGGTQAPMKLPDVTLPALDAVERCDSVVAAFGYSGSITKGGGTPDGFGVTRSFTSTLKDINVAFAPGAYVLTATLEHPITYQIRSGTGPDGQVDVGSDGAGAITAGNYATVASDLTPNMSDLNGRPPRTSFWAEDLTTKHELVHANDDKGNGPLAMVQVMTWLNTQTADNPFELVDLVKQVPKKFAANLLAALSTEDGEKHAYGDGAASYKARADSIAAKGAKGDYH
jgi:hypothetical protein